jgi:hypothetical protein
MMGYSPIRSHSSLLTELSQTLTTSGRCFSLSAPNNFGKSTLLRQLAHYLSSSNPTRSVFAVYVDCNLCADDTDQAFYALVVRSLLATLPASVNQNDPELEARLRVLYDQVITAKADFGFASSFLTAIEQHISTGQFVTDAWRKVFEDINDWLALEAGRQMLGLVSPLLVEIDRVAGSLQKQLGLVAAAGALDEAFWTNYHARLTTLKARLQAQAEGLAMGYYTDHRFSVYDAAIADTLQAGDAAYRRKEIIRLLQERTAKWFNPLWQLLARVAMTDLNAFVAEVRYRVLGLAASDSLLVGLELTQVGSGQLPPNDSLYGLLMQRYHADEAFRRQYAQREPSPAERLTIEIRGWLGLLQPPVDGLDELAKAITLVGLTSASPAEVGETPTPSESGANQAENGGKATIIPEQVDSKPSATSEPPGKEATAYTRFRVPVESVHPYPATTRQYWDITNPDEQASYTRLHFSRIDLSEGNGSDGTARIVIQAWGRQDNQVITGQHSDFWSEPFPGRNLTVRFVADQAQPGWGFVLDGLESL